jgi:hypothetical protein
MNRFKFRAWDIENKHMYYSSITSPNGGWLAEECKRIRSITFDEWGDIAWIILDWGGYGSGREFNKTYYADQFKIMQFTGFEDVNKKEVYDFDIVYNEDTQRHGLIYWDENHGTWRVQYNRKSVWSLSEVMDNLRPVVGNHYENKYLLESKND